MLVLIISTIILFLIPTSKKTNRSRNSVFIQIISILAWIGILVGLILLFEMSTSSLSVFLIGIAIVIIIWMIWSFFKMKKREGAYKDEIYLYFNSGLSFKESLKKAFSNLNESQNIRLHEETVKKIASYFNNLEATTDMNYSDAIYLYTYFIWWDVFLNGKFRDISDKEVISSLNNLKLIRDDNGNFIFEDQKI